MTKSKFQMTNQQRLFAILEFVIDLTLDICPPLGKYIESAFLNKFDEADIVMFSSKLIKEKTYAYLGLKIARSYRRRRFSRLAMAKVKKFRPLIFCLNSKRGSILIAVLWSLFFLAALAVVINVLVAPQLSVAAKLRDRVALHYLAQAGVKRAVLELRADETKKYDALNESWSQNKKAFKDIFLTDEGHFSLEYLLPGKEGEEEQRRYGLRDEERRLNINTAPVNILKSFFEIAAETSAQDAAGIAAALVDWRDADEELSENGAENPYYQALSPGYSCKNGGFEILEELLLVKGMTPAIFDKIKDRLTVFGKGKVNINTADALVLQGLGMSGSLVQKIITYRKGGDGQEATEDDNVFQDTGSIAGALSGLSSAETDELNALLGGDLMTTQSDYFRGSSSGSLREGATTTTIDFIVNRREEIVFWREE